MCACLAVSVFPGLSILVPRMAPPVTLAVRADARDVPYLSTAPQPRFEGVGFRQGAVGGSLSQRCLGGAERLDTADHGARGRSPAHSRTGPGGTQRVPTSGSGGWPDHLGGGRPFSAQGSEVTGRGNCETRALCVVQPTAAWREAPDMVVVHADVSTDLNPDCVAVQAPRVAVGAYELDEASGERRGRLYLYDCARTDVSSASLAPLSQADYPGILDLAWLPPRLVGEKQVLALCLANGQVASAECTDHTVAQSCAAEVSRGGLALSLDLSPYSEVLAVSSSQGEVCLLQVGISRALRGFLAPEVTLDMRLNISPCYTAAKKSCVGSQVTESTMTSIAKWQAHELEVWCCAFDRWQVSLAASSLPCGVRPDYDHMSKTCGLSKAEHVEIVAVAACLWKRLCMILLHMLSRPMCYTVVQMIAS